MWSTARQCSTDARGGRSNLPPPYQRKPYVAAEEKGRYQIPTLMLYFSEISSSALAITGTEHFPAAAIQKPHFSRPHPHGVPEAIIPAMDIKGQISIVLYSTCFLLSNHLVFIQRMYGFPATLQINPFSLAYSLPVLDCPPVPETFLLPALPPASLVPRCSGAAGPVL